MKKYTIVCLFLSLSACASGAGSTNECNMEGWNSFAKKVDNILDKLPKDKDGGRHRNQRATFTVNNKSVF